MNIRNNFAPFGAFRNIPPIESYLNFSARFPLIEDVIIRTSSKRPLVDLVTVLRSGTRLPLDESRSDSAMLIEQQRTLGRGIREGDYFSGKDFQASNVLKGAVPRLVNRWRGDGDSVDSLHIQETRELIILADPEVSKAYINALMDGQSTLGIAEWYAETYPQKVIPPSIESDEGKKMIEGFLGSINQERE